MLKLTNLFLTVLCVLFTFQGPALAAKKSNATATKQSSSFKPKTVLSPNQKPSPLNGATCTSSTDPLVDELYFDGACRNLDYFDANFVAADATLDTLIGANEKNSDATIIIVEKLQNGDLHTFELGSITLSNLGQVSNGVQYLNHPLLMESFQYFQTSQDGEPMTFSEVHQLTNKGTWSTEWSETTYHSNGATTEETADGSTYAIPLNGDQCAAFGLGTADKVQRICDIGIGYKSIKLAKAKRIWRAGTLLGLGLIACDLMAMQLGNMSEYTCNDVYDNNAPEEEDEMTGGPYPKSEEMTEDTYSEFELNGETCQDLNFTVKDTIQLVDEVDGITWDCERTTKRDCLLGLDNMCECTTSMSIYNCSATVLDFPGK
jgi:hypothetical protein